MAVDDVFEVRTQYTYLGIEMENRWFYLQTEGASGSALLGSLVEDDLMPPIQAIQQDDVVYSFILTRNLNDTGDFDTIAFSGVGVRTGDAMPPYVAWGFKLISSDRVLRSGGKRIGGVSETDVTDGIRDAGVLSALTGARNAIQADLESTGPTEVFTPVLHRAATLEPVAPAITVLIDTAPFLRVSTQNSRKFPA